MSLKSQQRGSLSRGTSGCGGTRLAWRSPCKHCMSSSAFATPPLCILSPCHDVCPVDATTCPTAVNSWCS